MRSFRTFLAFVPALALIGCASSNSLKSTCGEPVCAPIEITGFFSPSANPDIQAVKPGTSRVVVWKLGNSFFRFDSRREGLELLNPKPADKDAIKSCYVSADDQGAVEVERGSFYRCVVRGHAEKFDVRYNMHFRDAFGVRRHLDPLMTNNADPTELGGTQQMPAALRVRVAASGRTVPVALAATGTEATGVDVPDPSPQASSVVIWSAPSGFVFNTDPMSGQADGVVFPSEAGIVNAGCRATSDAEGQKEVDLGAFYRCTIWNGLGAISTTYDVRFRPATSGPTVAQTGKFRRAS